MSHIFIEKVPLDNLYEFFKKNAILQGEKYFFDVNLYRKGIFNENITNFVNTIEPYYKHQKKFYITRELTYKNFMTILRQLCRSHNIEYTNKIKYINNSYQIEYLFDINIDNDSKK
tara:strand:+ start:113 stop:460 length:348 start_codon:yes stop_codon:yes gene_type:complete